MKRFIIILLCILLSGCGFHLRPKGLFPTQLNRVYFFSSKPYGLLSIRMTDLLQADGVTIVKQKSNARFSIVISHDHFAYSQPDIVNLSLPTSINFIQSATIAIQDNVSKKIVASNYFETSRSLTLNANQIYTRNFNDEVHRELSRELSTLIYYWLVSNDTKDALRTLTHANHAKTT